MRSKINQTPWAMRSVAVALAAAAMLFAGCSKDNELLDESSALAEVTEQDSRATDTFFVDGIYYQALSVQDRTVAVVESPSNAKYSGDIVIPSSIAFNGLTFTVTGIGLRAFDQCPITSVVLPNTITTIDSDAFRCCGSLASIQLSNSLTKISGGAFSGCTSLISIDLPNSISYLGISAFSGCSSLTSVVLPSSLGSIDQDLFGYCTNLTSVVIPQNVSQIGFVAFYGCINLKEIVVLRETPPVLLGDEIFVGVSKIYCVLKVPAGADEAYRSTYYEWNEFWHIVPIDGAPQEEEEEVNLTDGDAYTAEDDTNVETLTYTRTFKNTSWQPLYIPFSMSYDEWSDKADVAELAGVHMYENRTVIEFLTVKEGELLPNVPYVIRAKEAGEDPITFTCTEKTLLAAPTEGTRFVSCSSPRWTYKIIGNHQPIAQATLNDKGALVMGQGKFGQAGGNLNPGRFYLVKEKSANGYWADTRGAEDETVYIMVDGELLTE